MTGEDSRPNEGNSRRIDVSEIEGLLGTVWPIPKIWAIVLSVTGLLSLLEITRAPGVGTSVTMRVTSITALLAALVWLPVIVKVVALVGGGIKTPAGEVRAEGLLELLRQSDPATKREALPAVIGALRTAESAAPEAETYRNILEEELATSIPPDKKRARDQLAEALAEYSQLRQLPFGPERTAKIGTVAARVRALATISDYTSDEIVELTNTNTADATLILVGLMQTQPDSSHFGYILEQVEDPIGPQEQHQALLALEAMLPALDEGQLSTLTSAIVNQEYIQPANRGRWTVSRRILSQAAERTE